MPQRMIRVGFARLIVRLFSHSALRYRIELSVGHVHALEANLLYAAIAQEHAHADDVVYLKPLGLAPAVLGVFPIEKPRALSVGIGRQWDSPNGRRERFANNAPVRAAHHKVGFIIAPI